MRLATSAGLAVALVTALLFVLDVLPEGTRVLAGPPPGEETISAPDPTSGTGPTVPLAGGGNAVTLGASPDFALGQPGLSFRYVRTLGQVETPYFDDTDHLNRPYGLGTDAANVWIAEAEGLRALKYGSDGTLLKQLGKAGFRQGIVVSNVNTDLHFVTDVSVDAVGNVWVADGGAKHVLKFDANGTYLSKLGQAWSSGTDNSHFGEPQGVAFDGAGNVYVSDGANWGNDQGNHRIQIFSSDGTYLNTIGVPGVAGSDNAHFRGPGHIAIDSANYLYVADSANHRVQVFDVSSPITPTYVATIGVSGQSGSDNGHLNKPQGVAVDATHIYVADTGNNRIQVFDRTTRAYQTTVGSGWGTGNGQFKSPTDVAVDALGNIYVADRENGRVQQFSPALAYSRTYGTTGIPYLTDTSHFLRPSGVAAGLDGSIYVLEENGARLVKLDANGTALWTLGEAGVSGSNNAHFAWPSGLALDPSGRVYVADRVNNRVQIFDADGAYVATLGTGRGTGDYQFNSPFGVAIDSSGNIYVADTNNQRVQVFDNNRSYVATIGTTGASGSDNAHFNQPRDVAVDTAGGVYIVDAGNHRVQVFDRNRAFVRTIGVSGVSGTDFGHLRSPTAVAVDAQQRTYVADGWGSRVQVFDGSGAYLTTLGGSSGKLSGQLRTVEGLAVDSNGNLYAADQINHRIQMYTPGVPDWQQSNLNGFGEPMNSQIATLVGFQGKLYAGVSNFSGRGAQLWQEDSTLSWTAVLTNGFGNSKNYGIAHLIEFHGQLYAGTMGDTTTGAGEIWRSPDGVNWTSVMSGGFGDPTNGRISRFSVYNDQLYATTWSYTNTHGTELWRSATGNTGDWTQIDVPGFSDPKNTAGWSSAVYNGYLYLGTAYNSSGGQVWRTDGATLTQVNASGFGTASNVAISALAVFDGRLYASTMSPGVQVWRCSACDGTDWTKVVDGGFGNTYTGASSDFAVLNNQLYLAVGNTQTGIEVWRTTTGNSGDWTQVGFGGFGDSNNGLIYPSNAMVAFNGRLLLGTGNVQGTELWERRINRLYLPVIMRN